MISGTLLKLFISYITAFLLLFMQTSSAHAKEFPVTNVIDGDTISIWTDQGGKKIRFYGIDTPELVGQPFGIKAQQATNRLLNNRSVLLKNIESKQSYDRIVATVHVGDLNINRQLVKEGLAGFPLNIVSNLFAPNGSPSKSKPEQKKLVYGDVQTPYLHGVSDIYSSPPSSLTLRPFFHGWERISFLIVENLGYVRVK